MLMLLLFLCLSSIYPIEENVIHKRALVAASYEPLIIRFGRLIKRNNQEQLFSSSDQSDKSSQLSERSV